MKGQKRSIISPKTITKRQKRTQNRYFQKRWELEFFVIDQDTKAICIVDSCGKRPGYMTHTIKYHFKSKHLDLIDSMKELSGDNLDQFKREKLIHFKNEFERKNELAEVQNIENKHKLASYKIAYLIAKHLKYFSEGNFVKECMVTVAKTLFPNNFEVIDQFRKVNLSRNSITDKIVKISSSFEEDLKLSCSNIQYFSICLDESNDKTDIKHLVFFIKGVYDNFEYFENFLDLVKLPKNSTGESLHEQLKLMFQKFDLNYEKLISVTSDGAKNLLGEKIGLIVRIKNFMTTNNIENEIINFHFLLHQENFCCKKWNLIKFLKKSLKL